MALTDANGEARKGIEVQYRVECGRHGWPAVPTEWDAEIACEEEEGRIPFYETIRDLMLAGF